MSNCVPPAPQTRAYTVAQLSLIWRRYCKIEKCCRAALEDTYQESINRMLLVGLSTQIPAIKKRIQGIFNTAADSSIDPNDAVAIGAAIQGAVLSGNVKDVLLLDAVPLSLCIETLGEVSTPVIQRNTTIPTRRSKIFTTTSDNQTAAMIHILQGERPMAKDNLSLGCFYLDGIIPAPRGTPEIKVTFDMDPDSILHVNAEDRATGKYQSIKVVLSTISINSSDLLRTENTQIQVFKDEDTGRKIDETED